MNHKTLILKMGYSEVLIEEENSRNVSFGDVLRTTVLLHLFKDDHVTWVTDEKAIPLLENNPYIDRILPYDLTTAIQLQSEEFDTIINLEKTPGICALADKIPAWRRYGFRFNKREGKAEAYDKSFEVLSISSDPKLKKNVNKLFQELLFEMLGAKWKKEEYVLGYKPQINEKYDVGLNTQTGIKWPTKSWPIENWDKLEEMFKKAGFKVSRQEKQKEILNSLYSYMDWINSCKLIVSADSLGLHLAIALKKKTLGLFGPTPYKEVYLYDRGKIILPDPVPECMSCSKTTCDRGRNCMENILPRKVEEEGKKLLNNIQIFKNI